MFTLYLALLSVTAGESVQPTSVLRVVDDMGQEIRVPLRVCLYKELLTECLERPPYVIPARLAAFTSVTAEGAGHGPTAVDRSALKLDRTGAYQVNVPRKAEIVLRGPPGPPVTISLYAVDDPFFRKPSFRVSDVGSEGVLVPAGEFLVTIADGTRAPAISVSVFRPGSRNTLPYTRAPGWSAVLRCQSGTALVPSCAARALSASRPSTQREIAKASGDRNALVAFPGITEPFMTVAVSAPGFVPQEVRGVTARTGSFAFHPVALARGGFARARVTLDEQPVRRARCRLLDIHGSDVGPPSEDTLYDGETNRDGICQTSRVAAGTYVLRVSVTSAGQPADEPVTLTEGATSEMDIRLRSIAVRGRVYRGTRPEPGMVVRIVRRDDRDRYSSTYLELNTDDEGRYRGVVWSTGEYSFGVMNAARSAVGTVRRVTVDEDGAEVDLHLNPYEISGRVLDEEERPVPSAAVLLTLNEHNHRVTKSLADGTFAFPMDNEGRIQLTTQKVGYQPGEAVEFMLAADAAPAPVILIMKKLPSIRGTVLWPSGAPASNVGVSSFQYTAGLGFVPLGAQRTDAGGAFDLPRPSGGMAQLFATGPGCPLLVSTTPPEVDEVTLRCLGQSAGVQLLLRDPAGLPRPHESIILRWEGTLIPRAVLRDHLLLLGLPTETDGTGRLILVGLPAGVYDVFLGRSASEATVAAGMPDGHLASMPLTAFDRPEIEVTIQ